MQKTLSTLSRLAEGQTFVRITNTKKTFFLTKHHNYHSEKGETSEASLHITGPFADKAIMTATAFEWESPKASGFCQIALDLIFARAWRCKRESINLRSGSAFSDEISSHVRCSVVSALGIIVFFLPLPHSVILQSLWKMQLNIRVTSEPSLARLCLTWTRAYEGWSSNTYSTVWHGHTPTTFTCPPSSKYVYKWTCANLCLWSRYKCIRSMFFLHLYKPRLIQCDLSSESRLDFKMQRVESWKNSIWKCLLIFPVSWEYFVEWCKII